MQRASLIIAALLLAAAPGCAAWTTLVAPRLPRGSGGLDDAEPSSSPRASDEGEPAGGASAASPADASPTDAAAPSRRLLSLLDDPDVPELLKRQMAAWAERLKQAETGAGAPEETARDVQPSRAETPAAVEPTAATTERDKPVIVSLSSGPADGAENGSPARTPAADGPRRDAVSANAAASALQPAGAAEELGGGGGDRRAGESAPETPAAEPLEPNAASQSAKAETPSEPPAAAPAPAPPAEGGGASQAGEDPPAEPRDPPPGQWRRRVADAIDELERELARTASSDGEKDDEAARARRQAALRLLYLLSDDPVRAIEPIAELDEAEQQFWTHILEGLRVLLDEQGTPQTARRAAMALRHVREASGYLASASMLDLRNLAFCTRVDSYGCWREFDKAEFRPNQEVLLYVEVENFAVEETPDGYETELRASYEIVDLSGRRFAFQDLPLDRQTCYNRRRDYFIAYRIYMPRRIPPGAYRLQLTMEDVKGAKFGQASIDFEIRP